MNTEINTNTKTNKNRFKAKGVISGKKIDNIQLFILALPAILVVLVFSYIPMTGIVIAFKDFKVPLGVFGSPWVGFKNFEFFFQSNDAWRTIRNTVGLNFLMITVHLFCAVGFALLCFRLRNKTAIKAYQTITIMPSFLSWVIVGYLVYALLKPSGGLVNRVIEASGRVGVSWYSVPKLWPIILTTVSLWHGVGRGSLFYFASMMTIDTDHFEAASLDGATKMQEFWYIIVPHLVPLIVIMQILAIGSIFRADFGLFFNVTRDAGALYPTTDVIDTYIYRSLITLGDIGMSSAVGVFQSIVGFVLILTTNGIVRKIDPERALY